jgi:transcriptional regulator GlxA family with amidase domain
MEFLKFVRLKNARKLLQRPDPATTVTGVALHCGFQNTGRFARDYREHFGEMPSATVQRAKIIARA